MTFDMVEVVQHRGSNPWPGDHMTEPLRCNTCPMFVNSSFRRICRLTGEPPDAKTFFDTCTAPPELLEAFLERIRLDLFRRNIMRGVDAGSSS